MRNTGSSDDLHDREEGETVLQRTVDPRFEDAKAANLDAETGEMALDILDMIGARLGAETGLPAMPGMDDDDEPATAAAPAPAAPAPAPAAPVELEPQIAFSALTEDDLSTEDDDADEPHAADENAQPIADGAGVRSLADLLANAKVDDDGWVDYDDEGDEAAASTPAASEIEDDAAPSDEPDLLSEFDSGTWPDEMDAEPDAFDEAEASEQDAVAVDAPMPGIPAHDPFEGQAEDPEGDDLSLGDLPPDVNELLGPPPGAPVDMTGFEEDVEQDEPAEHEEVFGEEWPFQTDDTAEQSEDPADMTPEGTDAMTDHDMTPEETAGAEPRKGFFGRFKGKAAPVAAAGEAPVETSEVVDIEETPQAEEPIEIEPQAEEAPAPRKSRKGLLLATTALAACVVGAGLFLAGQETGFMKQPATVIAQAPVAPAAAPVAAPVAAPSVTTEAPANISVTVVDGDDDLMSGMEGLYDPAEPPREAPALQEPDLLITDVPIDDMPQMVLSVDEMDLEPSISQPDVVIGMADQAPRIIDVPEQGPVETVIVAEPVISIDAMPVQDEPADIDFTAGMDDPGNGDLDDLFIRDPAPAIVVEQVAPVAQIDLSNYVPLTEFEALRETSVALQADIEELREAIALRDEAMTERDELLRDAVATAASAKNLAMSQNEVLVQVYDLGAKMETAESLVVDLSRRLAAVEVIDPANREEVDARMDEMSQRVEGLARDVGLVARMAINGGGKIPSVRTSPAVAPVMAEPVYDTGVTAMVAPTADPSKIPADVKIGQTVPGYGEVLDIIPTSDGGRLVVMEHGSAVLD